MKNHRKYNSVSDMNQFIGSLQKEDNWNVNLSRIMIGILAGIALIYSIFFIFNPSPKLDLVKRIGGFTYILAVILFIILMLNLIKDYKYVDYGLPVTEMLRQVVKRYTLCQKKLLFMILPLILVDASMILMTVDSTNWSNLKDRIIWTQEFFIPSLAFGAAVGITIWYIRQKPLLDSAREMLRELES
jgi:hypothetical protein